MEDYKMRIIPLLAELLILSFLLIGCSSAEKDYEKAQQENTAQAYEKFIKKHPQSNFVENAARTLDSLRFEMVKSKHSIEAYNEFVEKYPESNFVNEAKRNIDVLRIVLGFGRCNPVIFKPIITPLTVKISLITYVPYGHIQSYKLQITSNEEQISIKVKVNLEKFKVSGLCDDITYTVEINGEEFSSPTVSEFESMEKKNLIGFSPARVSLNPFADITRQEYRPEGAVLIIPGMNMPGALEGDFITKFVYKGYTRELDVQRFTLNAVQYEIRYKDYKYNDRGRIFGYTAQLVELTN